MRPRRYRHIRHAIAVALSGLGQDTVVLLYRQRAQEPVRDVLGGDVRVAPPHAQVCRKSRAALPANTKQVPGAYLAAPILSSSRVVVYYPDLGVRCRKKRGGNAVRLRANRRNKKCLIRLKSFIGLSKNVQCGLRIVGAAE